MKANALPARCRSSKEVQAKHEAIHKAAEKAAEREKAAVEFLAEMEIEEEHFDEEMEVDIPHHLSAVKRTQGVEEIFDNNECESFDSISEGPDTESERDDDNAPVKQVVSSLSPN